jgi:hypothetical protein
LTVGADLYHGAVRPRPASLAALAAAAGIATGLLLAGCGGSRDPRAPGGGAGVTGSSSAATTLARQGLPATGDGGAPGQPYALGATITVGVVPETIGTPMPRGFLGLSLEYPTLEHYLGTDPRHLDPVFLALLRALDPRQSVVVRLGGDSTDRTWWPIHGMRAPGSIEFALSSRWTAVARALAADTPGKLILGINLAAGQRRLAAIEARHLVAGVGADHIAALELGNEPDDYGVTAWYWKHDQRVFARASTYSVGDYLAQFAGWRAVMPRSVPVAGPALARTQWLGAALRAELGGRRPVSLVTFHRYPLRACETDPQASDYPTIPRLLSDSSSARLAAVIAPYVTLAHRAHRPFRLDELNSVSCKGKLGVSNTFASALWILDTLFNLRAVGVDGVNVHMLPGSPYQAFSVTHTSRRWSATVSPVYYGMLMFARAFPPGARLLGVAAPPGPVKAWATRGPNGRLRVVLINQDPIAPVTVRVRVPGAQTTLSSQVLLAPSVSATQHVSLGGETFGSSTRTGRLHAPRRAPQVSSVQGYYSVPVPAGSAVLLTR